MSHGENFREISHEKESHKQFRRIFHAHCPPPTPHFFSLLLPRGLMAGDRPWNAFIYPAAKESEIENRPRYALMFWRFVGCIFSLKELKKIRITQRKPHNVSQTGSDKHSKTMIQIAKILNTLNNHSTFSFQTHCWEMNVQFAYVFFLILHNWAGEKFPGTFFLQLCFQSAVKQTCQSPNKVIWNWCQFTPWNFESAFSLCSCFQLGQNHHLQIIWYDAMFWFKDKNNVDNTPTFRVAC